MKKMKRIILAMISLLACTVLGGCGTKTVNLNDYVSVAVTGVGTKGHAEVKVDDSGLEKQVTKALGVKVKESDNNNFEKLGNAFAELEKIERAVGCVEFVAEPAENLKNGDTVIVKANIDNDKAKELGLKFSFKEIKKKVEELQEAVVVSQDELFQDIVIEFAGTAPNAQVQIRNTSKDEIISKINFVANQTGGLDAGDKIIVTAENAENFEEEGYLFTELDKEYTVDKVDGYIKDFGQFPEEGLQKIMKQAGDMVAAQLVTKNIVADFYVGDDYISSLAWAKAISEPELQTSYFYSLKEGVNAGYGACYNALGIAYKFNLTDIGGDFFSAGKDYKDCYILISCQNMILNKNGELYFDINTMKFSNAYSSFDTFLMKEVDKSRDNYEIQEVELKNY